MTSSNSTDSPKKHINSLGFESIDQFTKAEDLQTFIQKLCKILDSRKENWKKRQSALRIIEIIANESLEYPIIHEFINIVFIRNENVKDLSISLIEQIQDNRSEIIKQASLSIQSLATALNKRFVKIARRIFPQLLKSIGRSNEVIRSHTDDAITSIIKHVHNDKLMFLLFSAFSSTKNMEVQEHCCSYFQLILKQWPFHSMMHSNTSNIKKVETFLREGLKGKSTNVRHCTATSAWYYMHHFPNRQKIFLCSLTPRLKLTVMNAQSSKTQDDINCNAESSTKTFIKPAKRRKRPLSHAPKRTMKTQKSMVMPKRTSEPLKRVNAKHQSLSPKPRRSVTYSSYDANIRYRKKQMDQLTDSRTDSTDTNDIDHIFNVNFQEFQVSQNEPMPVMMQNGNNVNVQFVELDTTATELHTEWKFFKSQVSESLMNGNVIMQKLKGKEDVHSIEEMINLFEKQKEKIDFIIHRFRNAQTECADIDSCEL